MTADGERWLLVNASPDVRLQAQTFAPEAARGSRIACIALTSADIDHVAGLLVLREGGAPPIYATPQVDSAVRMGLGLLDALTAYGPVDVRRLTPGRSIAFADRDGAPLGIEAEILDVLGKPPLYVRHKTGEGVGVGHTVALVLRGASGGTLVYAPGVSRIDDTLGERLAHAHTILFDGTCWTDDELAPLGGRTARAMGHLPMSGAEGTLEKLARYGNARRLYVHVNNTNPVLRAGSPERRMLDQAGIRLGEDGEELEV